MKDTLDDAGPRVVPHYWHRDHRVVSDRKLIPESELTKGERLRIVPTDELPTEPVRITKDAPVDETFLTMRSAYLMTLACLGRAKTQEASERARRAADHLAGWFEPNGYTLPRL